MFLEILKALNPKQPKRFSKSEVDFIVESGTLEFVPLQHDSSSKQRVNIKYGPKKFRSKKLRQRNKQQLRVETGVSATTSSGDEKSSDNLNSNTRMSSLSTNSYLNGKSNLKMRTNFTLSKLSKLFSENEELKKTVADFERKLYVVESPVLESMSNKHNGSSTNNDENTCKFVDSLTDQPLQKQSPAKSINKIIKDSVSDLQNYDFFTLNRIKNVQNFSLNNGNCPKNLPPTQDLEHLEHIHMETDRKKMSVEDATCLSNAFMKNQILNVEYMEEDSSDESTDTLKAIPQSNNHGNIDSFFLSKSSRMQETNSNNQMCHTNSNLIQTFENTKFINLEKGNKKFSTVGTNTSCNAFIKNEILNEERQLVSYDNDDNQLSTVGTVERKHSVSSPKTSCKIFIYNEILNEERQLVSYDNDDNQLSTVGTAERKHSVSSPKTSCKIFIYNEILNEERQLELYNPDIDLLSTVCTVEKKRFISSQNMEKRRSEDAYHSVNKTKPSIIDKNNYFLGFNKNGSMLKPNTQLYIKGFNSMDNLEEMEQINMENGNKKLSTLDTKPLEKTIKYEIFNEKLQHSVLSEVKHNQLKKSETNMQSPSFKEHNGNNGTLQKLRIVIKTNNDRKRSYPLYTEIQDKHSYPEEYSGETNSKSIDLSKKNNINNHEREMLIHSEKNYNKKKTDCNNKKTEAFWLGSCEPQNICNIETIGNLKIKNKLENQSASDKSDSDCENKDKDVKHYTFANTVKTSQQQKKDKTNVNKNDSPVFGRENATTSFLRETSKKSNLFAYLDIDYNERSKNEITDDKTFSNGRNTVARECQDLKSVEDTRISDTLDVYHEDNDDFDIKELGKIESKVDQIRTIKNWVEILEKQVRNFSKSKSSIEYFLLDYRLKHLTEHLDTIKCKNEPQIAKKKMAVINYITSLHRTLDTVREED